jgi:hypothetical protein
MRDSCLRDQYYNSGEFYPDYLLKAVIRHESLSLAMKDYPISVTEIVGMIDRLKSHASTKDLDTNWAEDLTAAEETHQSPTIGRVR